MIEFHHLVKGIAALSYLTLITSYVWARFFFFEIRSKRSRVASFIYDPAVAIQFITTLYFFYDSDNLSSISFFIASIFYCISLYVFWSTLLISKKLNFALGQFVGSIITNGSFGFVRHPLYFSYMITWVTSTILFDSKILFITLVALASFYFFIASKEEEAILKTDLATEYANYKQEVGMFVPRATQWKRWFSRLFRLLTR